MHGAAQPFTCRSFTYIPGGFIRAGRPVWGPWHSFRYQRMECLEKTSRTEEKLQNFARLRERVHESMQVEEERRLKENPKPTEEELYMGAFTEWLEPQVRDAIPAIYRKGYATLSSGFHAEEPDIQIIDGFFEIGDEAKAVIQRLGVEVLRGPDIGLPDNKYITMLRFRAPRALLAAMKQTWDSVAVALPPKTLPAGIRAICDRAEEFRAQYAPDHPSLEDAREKYIAYLRRGSRSARNG